LAADIVVPANAAPGIYNVRPQINSYGSGLYPGVPTAALLTVAP
jgi:hypothetical protein